LTLAQWLKQQKMSQAAFAKLIGSDQSHISDLVCGKMRPRAENIELITKATKGAVKFEDWVKRGSS
jgi:predicted XRE-type DNA-binding protein